jgi:hypothetical protein
MKRVALALVVVLYAVAVEAEVVRVRLAERRIEPGTRMVILSVYAAAEGGEPLATETRLLRVGEEGSLDLPLGDLAVAASGPEGRWLAVRIPPGVESRRVALASTGASGAPKRGITVQVIPDAAIAANGFIESSLQGFRFPDGSVQTTAAVGSTPGFGTPVAVGAANAAGAASTISRSDHVHAHGDQAGGTLHAAATTGTAGFLSAADKLKLDQTKVYVRTIIVNPVAGNPTASGTALLNALNGIAGNSATDPYLLKIEPGIYDIGATTLTMKTFVDIEGSGENATFIVAARGGASIAASAAAINTAASSALRQLTVTNTAPGSAIGIALFSTSASTSVSHVTINSTGAATSSIGVFASTGGTLTMSDVTLTATSINGTSGAAGVQLAGAAKATILDSRITAKGVGGTGTNLGINMTGATNTATIDGCTILATGTAGQNTGMTVAPGTATILNSTVQADTASSRTALSTSGVSTAVVNVFHSRILAATSSSTPAILSLSRGNTSTLRVATSQIDGPSVGTPKCVFVYNANMDDLNNLCPEPIA